MRILYELNMLYIYEIHMDEIQWNTYDLSIDRMPQRREVSRYVSRWWGGYFEKFVWAVITISHS